MNFDDILKAGAMENMDVSLNYDSPELLTSDFFESVLSLENNLEDGFLSNFEDDVNLSSDASHSDGVLSPQSFYSESDKNSTYSTENLDDTISLINEVDNNCEPVLMPILESIPNVTIEDIQPVPLVTSTKKQPTKILIQNPSNKKFIAKPMINATHIKKAVRQPQGKAQILKVQQLSNNCRPVLLPLSVQSIKILNSAADVAALTGNIKRRKLEPVQAILSSEDDDSNVVSSTNSQYPPLNLTNEEKRLLAKEGIQLPTRHPLTKNEERELKRIRRKIRNKISAQDSRKRKKEYVDGLEEKVKRGSEENKNLLQRVRELQRQNRTLVAHVNKLQALICNSTTTKATPSTCLMVVLLSALLVSLPNIRLFEDKQMATEQEQVSIRRSLLSSPQALEEDLNMEEFLVFKEDEPEFESKFGEDIVSDIENSTEKELTKMLEDVGKKYEGLLGDKNNLEKTGVFSRIMEQVKKFLDKDSAGLFGKKEYGGFHNKNGFIEPEIDEEDGPPTKRIRYTDPDMIHNENVVSTTLTTGYNGNSKNK